MGAGRSFQFGHLLFDPTFLRSNEFFPDPIGCPIRQSDFDLTSGEPDLDPFGRPVLNQAIFKSFIFQKQNLFFHGLKNSRYYKIKYV
jgi:nitrite reductase/ring-hydroxylating ferredoxin subunit